MAITSHYSKKWINVALISFVVLVLLLIYLQYNPTMLFAMLKQYHAQLLILTQHYPFMSRISYCIIYLIITSLALPGAALLAIAGGSLFGMRDCIILTALVATSGATLVCIAVRRYGKQFVEKRYPHEVAYLNSMFQQEGSFYLLTLRLIPIIPFFLVNILCGITSLPITQYIILSFIGMMPGIILYTYAGTVLASLNAPRDILSPRILIIFIILAAIPYLIMRIIQWYKKHKNQKGLS